jgi:hypothetical protein
MIVAHETFYGAEGITSVVVGISSHSCNVRAEALMSLGNDQARLFSGP